MFITRSGYDPEQGKHVNDPYLGSPPTLGACRPDLRKKLQPGDHIFTVSGRVRGFNQYVIGGFEVAEKINALEAYERLPQQRLTIREDGQQTGNIIVNSSGEQHELDSHSSFDKRIQHYIIGRNPMVLRTAPEIALARLETMEILQEILGKHGDTPFQILGRSGASLTEAQVVRLREWMASIISRVS